jgi:hypothetical protein
MTIGCCKFGHREADLAGSFADTCGWCKLAGPTQRKTKGPGLSAEPLRG